MSHFNLDFFMGAMLSPALAGTRRACRAGERSHPRVYTRDLLLQRFYGAEKTKFSWSLLTPHLYTRQLAFEPQTGSLASQLLSGTERKNRPVLSIEVLHPATYRRLLLLYHYARTNSAKSSW